MRICKNCHQTCSGYETVCPVCGGELLDTDEARANAATVMAKYDQSESKFGKFMKATAKVLQKMCETIEKKA